jgi:Protein of unknown function (DUF4013)
MITMEYGKAFAFITDDNEWIKKFLVAALMPIIPLIGGLVLLGYSFEITRRVIKNLTPALPEWNDFGEYLKNGFFAGLITFIYILPVALLSACLNVPAIVLQTADDSTIQTIGLVVVSCGTCILLALSMITTLLIPPALGRFADTGQWTSALRIGDIVSLLRAKPGVYIISMILITVAGLVLLPLGLLLCGVGIFLVVAFLNLVAAHLHGQAYRVAAAEAAMP